MDVGNLAQLHVRQVDVVDVSLFGVVEEGCFAFDVLVRTPWAM